MSTVPTVNANEGVLPTTDVTATFSEDMRASSINSQHLQALQAGLHHQVSSHGKLPRQPPPYGETRPNQLLTEGVDLQGGRDQRELGTWRATGSQWEDSWFFTVSK